jgi:gas vesicle protein
MDTTGKIVTGFLLGAIAGTIAGLLIAPERGSETRKIIGKQSSKLAKQVAGFIGMGNMQLSRAHSKNGKSSVTAE